MALQVCTACFRVKDTTYRLLIDRIQGDVKFHLAAGQPVALPNGSNSDALTIDVLMEHDTPPDDPIIVKLYLANGDVLDIEDFAVATGDTRVKN